MFEWLCSPNAVGCKQLGVVSLFENFWENSLSTKSENLKFRKNPEIRIYRIPYNATANC